MFWKYILMKLGRLTNLPEWLLRTGFQPLLGPEWFGSDVRAMYRFGKFFCEIPQARTPQNGFYVMVFRLFGARYGMPIESFRMSQECQYFQAFIRF